MAVAEIMVSAQDRMKKAVEALKRELDSIRTGRASPALVERIRVDYYGVPTPLNQLAGVAAPEARLLVIQPFDRSLMGAIEKAILKSDLGLTPTNDGSVLRLAIPPLTEERRQELIKVARKRVEGGRISLRNNRRDALEEIRKLERDKAISKDEELRAKEELQKLTEAFVEEASRIGQDKETEIMEV